MKTAVFIGRFQPFHNGHKYLIDYAIKKYNQVIILVGSCTKHDSPENPFTYEERKLMVLGCYDKKQNLMILPLKDDPDDLVWERCATELITTYADSEDVTIIGFMKPDCFYLEMFQSLKKEILPGCFFNPEQGDILNATFIRNEFFKHRRVNYSVVPLNVKEFLFRFQGSERYETIRSDQVEVFKNPIPTVDIIIACEHIKKGGIVLIYRKNDPVAWALPGGFVDYGESLENAAKREASEETNLDVGLIRQFHCYSEPSRDPRQHILSIVFIAYADGIPRAGDDAADIGVFTKDSIPSDIAFDHKQIIDDYFNERH